MAFQPQHVLGANVANATGYSIVFTSPLPTQVSFACKGGEYWVRPSSPTTAKVAASAINALVTDPRSGAVASGVPGWVRLLAGDSIDFGSEAGEAGGEPISQVDIFVVTGGADSDLIVNAH
jgi:hypothetical protein